MKKNYHNSFLKNLKTNMFSIFIFGVIFLTNVSVYAQAVCPEPGGGTVDLNFDAPSGQLENLYPQSVPSGQTGNDKSTIGQLSAAEQVTSIILSNVFVIRPVLDNGNTGSVALYFKNMGFGDAPNAVLKIYQGTSTAVPPTVTINAANAASFPGTSLSYAGPVTIQFESTTPGTTGNFNIQIRFSTGDQVFNSSFGRSVAAWTAFVQPNSYTFIDDHRGTVPNPIYGDNWNPISIGYFDANRQFISADMSYCVDSPRNNVGFGYDDYPGRTNFTSYTNFDIDRSGAINSTDQLKMARVAWLLANRTTVPLADLRSVQDEVWSIVDNGTGGGSETAVPSLPTPSEPTFSIAASPSSVLAGSPTTFTVNFNMAGNSPKRLKLVVPSGVTIGTVSGTGVTYSSGFLNFATLPATATIQATSATAQTAQLQVVYDETGYWNVSNLKVYQPCDNGGSLRQDFVGMSQGVETHPYREASATWIEPVAFDCDEAEIFYSGGVSSTTLNLVNSLANPLTYSPIGAASTPIYNGIGISPIDGFIYAMPAEASNHLLKIDATGSVYDLGPVAGLPNTFVCTAGEIDDLGNYYVMQNTGNLMYKIDVNALSATSITLSPTVAVSDITFSVSTGLLYGTKNGNGELVSIDPVSGTVTTIGTATAGVTFGAMMGSNTGDIFGISNNGGFYKFNITTGIRIKVADATFLGANVDGAHCVNAPIKLPLDLSITKTDGTTKYTPGTNTVYTVVVTNNGPFDLADAFVTDAIPAGLTSTDVSYTAVASSGSSTSVIGTQQGAINDLVSLLVNGTVTYTITVSIPASFTGSLLNTAIVTPSSTYSESNTNNNTATDTDTNPIPFNCMDSNLLYSGSPSGNTTLYDVNYSGNPLTRNPIGSATYRYNSIGANPLDGFVYGIWSDLGPNSNHLLMITAGGDVEDLGPVAGLPTQATDEYNTGDFSADGYLYVMNNNTNTIYKIDVVNISAIPIALNPATSIAISDIAYHNGLFYGVLNSNSQLVSIDPATGVVTNIGTTHGTGVFGAMFGACNGVFGIANNGGFYQFNITTGARSKLADTPSALSGVDGAHCYNACIDITPLPVKLINFNATSEGSVNSLTWATSEEVNSSYFGVEHSGDAKNWESLGNVKSHENSATKQDYLYTHATPSAGINYYRLKMVDLDGKFTYSAIRQVQVEGFEKISVYPNPVSSQLFLKNLNIQNALSIKVVNIMGAEVYASTTNFKSLDVSHLNEGIYYLIIKNKNGNQEIQRFIVRK